MPAETSGRIGLEFKYRLIKLPITTVLIDVLEIDLRRYHDKHPEHQRNEKACEPFAGKLFYCPFSKRHISASAGDKK